MARKPPSRTWTARFGARYVFWVLFGINVANYLDRFVAIAVGPTLKAEFHLHDREIGALSSAFLLIYTVSVIPLGLLADRARRARVVAAGVALWSIASGATAFIGSFFGLALTRAGVGIGEASYYPAGTALLSAHYPREQRARVMSRWSAGQMVGIALAFLLSAVLAAVAGSQAGWRLAFLFTAPPGLALALLIWRAPEAPPASVPSADQASLASKASESAANSSVWQQIARVLRLRTVLVVIVLQALTFAVVAPTVTFLPIYVQSRGGPFRLSEPQTALLTGFVVVVGGLCGTLLGGVFADYLGRRTPGGRVLAAGLSNLIAVPSFAIMLLTHSLPIFVSASTLAVLALSVSTGPLSAASQDVTPLALRATSVALILLGSHLFGDVWSPGAVGALSTHLREHADQALLWIGLPLLTLAAIVGIWGSRFYAREVLALERSDRSRGESSPISAG